MTILPEIERDLRAFADPWSPVLVEKTEAVWERAGEPVTVKFEVNASGSIYPDVVLNDQRYTYRQFLAGPTMANLDSFAENITKTLVANEGYVETWATRQEDDVTERIGALSLIQQRATEHLPFLSTRVVLVRGEAGSGKTVTLREATARQADRYCHRHTGTLFFLVDAQGRALSRLEDAMAKDLHDLRAAFSYAAVAPLARHGLLVPIIDGFDELLGSGGYDEAFSSLAAFLATLNGLGSVVASARSAFFDYRNFYDNAARFASDKRLNYEVETISVEPWDSTQIQKYITNRADRQPDKKLHLLSSFTALQDNLSDANRQLLSKPFYASRVADLLAGGSEIDGNEDLLDQLVDSFVEREHRKLLDKDNKPLLSVKGHRAFLTALAEEMWWQENRRLDVGTIQAVAELITESFSLPSAAALAIVERVSSYAFLTSEGTSRRTLRFEHEVFYGYFLAHRLRDFIEKEPADLRRFLSRSVADATLVEQTVRLLGLDSERCSRAIEAVSGVLRPHLSDLVARQNAGVLIAAIFRSVRHVRSGLTLRNVAFERERLGPLEAEDMCFNQCDFGETDLTSVVLRKPRFVDCSLRNTTVDLATTRLDGAEATLINSIHGLVLHGEHAGLPSGKVYAPDDVEKVLRVLGVHVHEEAVAPVRTRIADQDQRIDVLDRFLTKMERRFYAADEDIARFAFAQKACWKDVRRLLEEHGLLEEIYVQKSGPSTPLIRLTVPPDVIRRGEDARDTTVPSQVRRFWLALLS